ncbi:MAG TPA: hypothetical protein VFH95_00805 [Candidatus Kapabacteria bacterium]|nr:hypothetical protein [Candidatus Kapabacteria bacterium]
MKFKYTILLFAVAFASCAARQVEKSTVPHAVAATATPENSLPKNFKFSLFISANGDEEVTDTGTIPSDSWTLDTSGSVNVRTSRRTAGQNFQNLNALAQLDLPDMDSLRSLIRIGKLYALDSSDLTQQCAGDEHYIVRIVPLLTIKPVSLSFDACAADYNLLLQPQRRYFRRFMDWWERMRVKYRPVQP